MATKYSEDDPKSKSKGGLQPALTEELLASQGELKSAIFDNPVGVIVGPVEVEGKWFVIEVDKINLKKVESLAEASLKLKPLLEQEKQHEHLTEFISAFQSKWTSRTFCASDFLSSSCANHKSSGHPSGALEACYEADPKGGLPKEGCPAPVQQAKPALPGSITPLKPEGEPLAQRPHPAGGESEAAPEGWAPPSAEAP